MCQSIPKITSIGSGARDARKMLATPSLLSGQELPALQAIEHFIGQKIPRLKLENFSYLYTLFESESAASGRRTIGGGRTHRGYSFGRRR